MKTKIPFFAFAALLLLSLSAYAPAEPTEITGGAYLTFAGKFGGEVTKQELAAHRQVGIAGCAAGSEILQFTLYISHKGKTTPFSSKSCELSDAMQQQLRSLVAGDSFYFERIQAKLPEGGKVEVHARKFTVV